MKAKNHLFFAVTAPGLEKVCADEIRCLFPEKQDICPMEGGVEFWGRLHDMYKANLFLACANRVLMRVASFYARDFASLESAAKAVPWELIVPEGSQAKVRAASHASSLYHTQAIRERVERIVDKRLEQAPPLEGTKQSPLIQEIFIRVVNNHFTVSLDTSGELLYKRGIKTNAARAPMRATLGAALLRMAGYDGTKPLCDPMCGSGTLSLEGAFAVKKIPAGWHRDFAFLHWPSFLPGRWRHLRRECTSLMQVPQAPLVFASDVDGQACRALRGCLEQNRLSDAVMVRQKDFFSVLPEEFTREKGLVVLNPPYGKRLGNAREAENLFAAACQHLGMAFSGWEAALAVPHQHWMRHLPFNNGASCERVAHGGLKVALVYGRIP